MTEVLSYTKVLTLGAQRICYHERLRPTEWNQSKPEPCKMVAHTVPRGYVEWYCPICDWGWSSPDEHKQAMKGAIKKAAQAVFGREDIDASTTD